MASTSSQSQIFSLGRFGASLRKEWGENRRQLMLLILLAVGMIAVASVFWTSSTYDSTIWLFENQSSPQSAPNSEEAWRRDYSFYHSGLYGFMAFILVAFTAMAASMAFSGTASKEGMLNQLMNPASQCEKFATKFTVYCIGGWLASTAAWALTVFGTYIVMDWFTPYGEFYAPAPVSPILTYDTTPFATFGALTVFSAIYLQSLFFMGSTLWPRNSFIKTFGAAFALFFSMMMLFVLSVTTFKDLMQPGTHDNIPAFFTSPYTRCTFIVLLTVANYAIAFIRCREAEVVRRW